MNFRLRMALAFTLLVGVLLAAFGYFVLLRSEALREMEFFDRLEDRAVLVEHLLLEARTLPLEEAEHLARVVREALPNEALVVIGTDGGVLFQRAAVGTDLPASWREAASRRGTFRLTRNERQFVVVDRPETRSAGILYTMASAIDEQGLRSLVLLRRWVIAAIGAAVLITALLAWWYASWALAPVRALVERVGEMKEPAERLPQGSTTRPDELGEVAIAFNGLLARLDEAFQVQRSFIATASHELRTPLTVLRGKLHEAMLLTKTDSTLQEHFEVIEDQALHMQDLLTQLLWLARTQSATAALLTDRVRLDEIAERAMERCRMRYPEVPLRFALRLLDDDRDPVVLGNAVLLTAALYNLLSNGAKYGGGTLVELVITIRGTQVICAVHDSGPGMSMETLARARDLFYRAADAPVTDGHGIGLSLVDRVARVHGGHVTITSAPGKGTTVEVSLPIEGQQAL